MNATIDIIINLNEFITNKLLKYCYSDINKCKAYTYESEIKLFRFIYTSFFIFIKTYESSFGKIHNISISQVFCH